ncbi:MAG: C25 family cysteine peptidase, partial [Flavitalea sp.]
DKALYRSPAYQHTSETSLFTDTAVYFLSVNTTGSGFMYFDPGNDVASNALPAETYFMDKSANYYRTKINAGFAAVVGEYVYSSSYDKGEFWSSAAIKPLNPLVTNKTGLQVYSGGPAAVLKYGAMGDALNPRTVKVTVNGSVLTDTSMDYFNDINSSVSVPLSLINSGNVGVQFDNTSGISADRMIVSYFELFYPKPYSFDNKTNFKFSLPASGDKYLQITNFNYGSTAPVLLNLTTGERMTGDISTPGTVKFVVAGGGARDFVLVSEASSNINTISTLTPKTFKLFTNSGNQGDYLIISNKILFTGTHGNDAVDDYKNYRASAAGGGYTAQVVDIDELVDQFAFGIKKDPIGIKNFIRYARNKFSFPVKYVFLIGRGVAYVDFQANQSNPNAEKLNLVPTFGTPGSDNMLSSADASSPVAVTPIGRLSVIKASEIEDYLTKVKEYESAQKNAPNTIASRAWMKNVVHVTGSSDPYLGTVLCNYMGVYKQIIQDTVYGGIVSSFCKVSTNSGEHISDDRITQLFQEGISVLTYFGHSSTTSLEFNLDNPQAYNNQGKYPVFFVNGCNAGNFFTYNQNRLIVNETLSEKFVLAKEKGSIAFVASTHFGIVNYLNIYLTNLYGLMSGKDYGKSLGQTIRDALQEMVNATGPTDYYARLHAEQMTLHGDPSIMINYEPKPDYAIEEPQVIINPAFISVAEDHFTVSARIVNLGKANNDSIYVEVKRQFPDGSVTSILHKKIAGIRYQETVNLDVPIIASHDKGLNKIIVTVDSDNQVDEMDESNNSISKEAYIYENEARTIYPYDFAIIKNQTQKLYASTADPLSPMKQYLMEIDTSGIFTSANKISKTITSIGGVLEFDPGITYVNKRVYYWRVSPVPEAGKTYTWNDASFVYMDGNKEGFSQSHYYQHNESKLDRIYYNAPGKYEFGTIMNSLFVRNGVYPFSGSGDADFSINVNGVPSIESACLGLSLIFNVFDSITFKPWRNVDVNGNNLNLSGSASANCAVTRNYNFEFSYMTAASRKNMMNFMDSIPNGSFVVVRNIITSDSSSNKYVDTWQSDTALYGSYNSIYHRLLAAGFTKIDSFYKPRSFNFIYKKGNTDFVPFEQVSAGIYDRLSVSADCLTPDSLGFITSPAFGPAKAWSQVTWNGTSIESPSHDNPSVDVIGIDASHNETVLYSMDRSTKTLDISSVSAAQYPQMKLRMRNADSVSLSPFQLTDWKIYYQPIPEGALAANIQLSMKDTVEPGELINFQVAFKNVSPHSFDSLSLKMNIVDNSNVTHIIPFTKQKPLISGDTVVLHYSIDTKLYLGTNTIFLDVNPPDNAQPEQYHFNNFLYKTFYVRTDKINPTLDVTFDGVHILNKDLVSAKPHIQIKLKDDAKFLLLNDTALSSIQIRYPDGTSRTYHFDNDTLRFIPATSGTDNTATVEFSPYFSQQLNVEGDEYELIVTGKDRSGNKAGANQYRVSFTVITKPMISNLLNYPNPFSTSTAFVFTVTGSDVPQNMKIQVLTVTGKIVREITKEELGPIHIGRNITDYKWDGKDQFGQKLGNGVYLYRFVTQLNGQRMEKYKARGDNTDQYFNNGYGKMYLMR